MRLNFNNPILIYSLGILFLPLDFQFDAVAPFIFLFSKSSE